MIPREKESPNSNNSCWNVRQAVLLVSLFLLPIVNIVFSSISPSIYIRYVTCNIWSVTTITCLKPCSLGCRLPQWVARASHVQRLCPRCSGSGFDSRQGSLCCVLLLLSLILFPVEIFSCPIHQAKNTLKKTKKTKKNLVPWQEIHSKIPQKMF